MKGNYLSIQYHFLVISRPDYLYGRDVNGDGREDIVAKCRSEEIVYIQQEDGTYRRLEK